MTVSRSALVRGARDLFIFALVSVAQVFWVCPRCDTPFEIARVWLFNFSIWVILWKGNDFLAEYISIKIPWIKFPIRRMLVGFISTITYSVLAVIGLMLLFESFFGFNFGSSYRFTIYATMGITIVISLVLHSRSFFLHWRRAALDAERFEKESIAAKYENLKSQINPHFLFNALNVLTNVVYEDPDKAAKFIKQLSAVYRHVLDTRDKEVVTLEDEKNFLASYLYLQQIRFGSKLIFDMDVAGVKSVMPPLVLQMLIENAIKHNVVSEENPLTIRIFVKDDFITVENNLQPRAVLPDESAGIGLENIRRRYEFLTSKPVEVSQGEKFIVKLPVIPVE